MNNKVIALVLIAVLGGLGGGYGLGYLVYHPQLQSIQNDLDDLSDKVDTLDSAVNSMRNKEWHEVYSLESSSDSTSGTIQLKGSQVRAMWIATSDYIDAWLSIILHFSNGTEYAVWGSSGVWIANNTVLELPQAEGYYLSITTYQTSYIVSFWDYY